jgi:hypothetical protein
LLLGGAGFLFVLGAVAAPADPVGDPVNFDRDIQPLLVRCVHCHGSGKAKAGLRLDSREAATALLKSGNHALTPGQPDKSELLNRVLSSDVSGRMPPKGEPLSRRQVEQLRRWIADGAVWPPHWAYRPLTKAPVPRDPAGLAGTGWAQTPIDHFILAKLAEWKLTPAPPADKRTLLRRVYLDLIGLPPTPAEYDAFLRDEAPDVYERVVDRLLASPHYGERQARHWMDVVHFAETHGHDQDRPREHAWPYRDYLIRSFNEDKPYGRFVQEQVAVDVLWPDDVAWAAAIGFLAAGPWDESSLRDIREDSLDREIGRYLDRDDIVSTVMSTFSSTTIHCARCHDHKFDPITQEEYYGLQAVFAATDKANRTYDADPQVAAARRRLIEQKARLPKQQETADRALLEAGLQAEVAEWQQNGAAARAIWQVLEPADMKSAAGATLTREADRSVFSSGSRPEADTYTIVAHTELPNVTAIQLEVLSDERLPQRGPGRQENGNLHLNEFIVSAAPRDRTANPKKIAWQTAKADFDQDGWTVAGAIDGKPETAWGIYPRVGQSHRAVFVPAKPIANANGTTLTFQLEQTHGRGHLIGRLRFAVTAAAKPLEAETLPPAIVAICKIAAAERTDRQRAELAAYYLKQKLDRELATLPAQQRVYCGTSRFEADGSFRPASAPRAVHVLERGDIRKPKTLAQPGALSLIPGLEHRFRMADPNDEGARRAALARWLAEPGNGLTWRSIANRVWQTHFGRGLVDTPNDFGRMGSPPTHPELLDWLAVALQENGGSLKSLHRLIVTSAAYRQSSRHDASFAAIDGDNRYLWRMNRQRLDAESIHDALLHASGKLDVTMGGPSVKQFIQTPGIHVTPNVDYANFNVDDRANYRRSVYRFIFRTLPDPFMECLDCPDGAQLTPVRSASVTALQALSLLNDKFVVRQTEHIARRVAHEQSDVGPQVNELYRLLFGRSPTPQEAEEVAAYAARHGLANACRVLVNTSEFIFID